LGDFSISDLIIIVIVLVIALVIIFVCNFYYWFRTGRYKSRSPRREIENEINKIAENVDVSTIDSELLIDFIQKQQVSSAIAISLLRKKMEKG